MSDWVDAEEHVERAHEHYEAGRWDDAESELRRALALNPYQAEWHFNLGLTLEAAGRHEQAIDAFRACYELRDEDAPAALAIGINLVRVGKPAEAITWLERAEKQDPSSASAIVHRIDALTDLGEIEQAELAFYMGQQIEPENADLYSAMADTLLAKRDFERAIWCLREAARLNADLPRIHARLARAYAATGRQERARQLYHRELRQEPGDIDTLLDLGDLLSDMNRLEEAGEKYRRVLELEPDHPDAHFALGELAVAQGKNAEACVQFDVVLRLEPDHPDARTRLADLLLAGGKDDDARRARELLLTELRRVRLETAGEVESLSLLGQLMLDADLPREAARVFRRLIELRPGDALSHHHLSVALLETGELETGADEAKATLRLNPRFVPAMHNLALAYLRRGEWLRARYWARQAQAIDPDDASLRRLRLMMATRSGASLVRFVCLRGARVLRRGWSLVGRPTR
ncbi:MAG: tetratricopeptide repeat protein [Leptolyngbya sp. PLA3]|nr:MAG: tetratricopeptide repeat protein [Cyanobacteria bacterium CYA]MCE7968624.1 tetratricopeptide repeat protein [Leptolyngbya sp. PL-A3]